MSDRFGRDPGTEELIEYYNQPERCSWVLLSAKEKRFLQEEILRCMNSFEYCARNYFWISTKDMRDVPLRLMDTQELVLEAVNRLKAKGRGVRLLIIKARQLYVSTFVEAYVAWCCMFQPNANALVLSYDTPHAASLFSIILHIYDRLPWWLRPMIGPRKYMEELHLINPDPELRAIDPGLNTRIVVQSAGRYTGVAEGYRINFAHISELGSMDEGKARSLIFGDLRWALPDDPTTFAVIESRVKRSARFLERLWESQVRLGDVATWFPLFLPIYFDKSHFIPPEDGWRPEEPELAVKERAAEEWCVCSNCQQIRPTNFGGQSMRGAACSDCQVGTYQPYDLKDGQMRWLWQQRKNAEAIGESALMDMRQSLATSPQEAFQYVTETLFSKAAMDRVASSIREPLAVGFMDSQGVFHAPRRHSGAESAICWARGCTRNHAGEPDRFLRVWEMPIEGAKYSVGVDVASGQGRGHDYSVIWVNRLGIPPNPDVQVACFRSDSTRPTDLALVANAIGRWYNNALMTVDYTNFQTVGDQLRHYLNYPNLYQWKNLDSANVLTPRYHWVFNSRNKEDAWIQLDAWLADGSLIVRDEIFAWEMRHFARNEDGSIGCPERKRQQSWDGSGEEEYVHDDTVTACQLALLGAHQMDRRVPGVQVSTDPFGLKATGPWVACCLKCGLVWHREQYNAAERCPLEGCKSIMVKWRHESWDKPENTIRFEDMDQSTPSSPSGFYPSVQELTF